MSEVSDDQLEKDMRPTTSTTRRGRGKAAGRRVTQVTKREFIEPAVDEEGEDERLNLPGMFKLSDIEEHSIVRVRVYRKDPDEGMLGYLEDPNASEEEIAYRWGGSQYRVEGLDQTGRVRAARTFRLAGDPVFVSDSARQDWEKRRGIRAPIAAAAVGQSLSPTDMLSFMRSMDEERRKGEEERRTREADERRQHEEKMRRLELEADERRRRDERDREERKNKEDREREERRQREDNEREERRRRDAAEAEARARAHTDQMLAMVKASSEQALQLVTRQAGSGGNGGIMEAVKMVVAIKEAFAGEGGGSNEESDPLNLLIKHGPEWLGGLGQTITGAIREVKANGNAPVHAAPTQPQLPTATAEGLTIPASSPLAGKLGKLAADIAARGQNPEAVLAQVVDNLQATLDGKPVPHQAPAQPAQPTPSVDPGFVRMNEPDAVAQFAQPAASAAPAPTPAAGPRAKTTVEKTARGSTKISFGG